LDLSNEDWELAALNNEPFNVNYGKDADIAALLEKLANPTPEPVNRG
jgi:hypothetical protein